MDTREKVKLEDCRRTETGAKIPVHDVHLERSKLGYCPCFLVESKSLEGPFNKLKFQNCERRTTSIQYTWIRDPVTEDSIEDSISFLSGILILSSPLKVKLLENREEKSSILICAKLNYIKRRLRVYIYIIHNIQVTINLWKSSKIIKTLLSAVVDVNFIFLYQQNYYPMTGNKEHIHRQCHK